MNETIEAPEATTESPVQTLSATDRCDLCGSRAYVQVFFETGSLMFCGHHSKKFDVKMREKAVSFIDETSFITSK